MRSFKAVCCSLITMALAGAVFAQEQYTLSSTPDTTSVPLPFSIETLNGSLLTFNTLVDFQTAAPMATNSEDFDTNNAGGILMICPENVNSTNNNTCFTPGQVVDGIDVTSDGGNGLALLPAGFNGLASAVLGPGTFPDTTNLAFTGSDTQAFAFDVFSGLAADDIVITVFDTANVLIGSVTVSGVGALPDNQFIGVISPVAVGRVNIETLNGIGELFDNLLFGPTGPADVDASLVITNNAFPPVAVGTSFDFTMTALNAGPGTATNVAVNNTLSGNLDVNSTDCGAMIAGNLVTWTIGDIASGATAVCNINVTVNAPGQISSNGTISTDDNDLVPANNTGGNSVAGVALTVPTLSISGIIAMILALGFGLVVYRRYQQTNS